jgi:Calcineurin-like phosphoesterase
MRAAAYTLGWAVIAVPVAVYGFLHDSRTTVLASHDATVSPTLDGWATIDLGAYLPNVRYPTGHPLGVDVEIGKTNVDNYDQLLERYALIASQPDGQIGKVDDLLVGMAWSNAFLGALVGLVGPGLWLLLGSSRRRELITATRTRHVVIAGLTAVAVVAVSASRPWAPDDEVTSADEEWRPIAEFLPSADIPAEASALEVQGGLITTGSRRLIESAFDTYRTSREFYAELADEAPALAAELRQPEEDETVVLLVADRHDNVGMDQVARAIGDAGGATVLFDAGDDTSTGEQWEEFSLDSLTEHFEDYDERYVALGNHDEGSFVGDHLDDKGFTVLSGEPVTTGDDILLLGAPDPRSSGLGNWRVESGTTMVEQEELLAETACESRDAGRRIATMLVHDTSLGEEALERGCVDLVVGGHLHSQVGPERVVGPDGEVGYTYTSGTSGGAAYAFALGSKLRRDAQVALITYREGHPVGIQAVDIITTGRYQVQPYVELAVSAGTSAFQVPAPPLERPDSPAADRDAAGR